MVKSFTVLHTTIEQLDNIESLQHNSSLLGKKTKHYYTDV
jgi:hypothetical protein